MAGENVASPSPAAASAAPSQPIPAASPTAANINAQQVSSGAPPPAHQPQLAVNLSQPQNFAPNQQTLNQISFSQQQPKPGAAGATRSLHTQYVQNVQNPTQQQQPPSPAMGVQSPPQSGATSIPRSSSASRIVQGASNSAGLRAATGTPSGLGGQFMGSASLQQQQQQQQQQMLASQRMSQAQGGVATQQRPAQSGQTSHLQSGQLPSAGLMSGSSSMRQVYSSSPYMQVRPTMGGQMQMPMSPQYTALHQQMRQKAGQVSASQFASGATPTSQLHLGGVGSISGVGSQLTRPSGSVVQQSQPANRMQTMQNRQAQTLQQSQPSAQLSQQQASPQIQKVPSINSLGTGLQSSSQSLSGASNLQNQAWMQKPSNQVSSAQASYQVSPQQAALLKQGQAQYSHHLQGQPQQAQPSPLNQQHQIGRLQSAVNQRSAGVQPAPLGTGTPTTVVGANTQSFDAGNRILGKRSIQELVAQVDPNRRLDPEVEDMLLEIADDFIESVTTFACKLAKHRKSNILEAKDVLLHLNRNWDLSIPGFNSEEYQPYKKTSINETHKQRLALIKKSMATQQAGQDPVAAKAAGGAQPVNTSTPGSQAPATA